MKCSQQDNSIVVARQIWALEFYQLVGSNHESSVLPSVNCLTSLCLGALAVKYKTQSGTCLLWFRED